MAEAEGATDLIGWLLVAGGANWSKGYAFLAVDTYGDAEVAVGQWLNEFRRVLAARQAVQFGGVLRPLREIEAEINTLPTVPLEEAGAVERDRLRTELTLAAIPLSERVATKGAAVQLWDWTERAALARAAAARPSGFRFVDAGSNVGLYTLAARSTAHGDFRALAIEPDAENRRRLRFNLAVSLQAAR